MFETHKRCYRYWIDTGLKKRGRSRTNNFTMTQCVTDLWRAAIKNNFFSSFCLFCSPAFPVLAKYYVRSCHISIHRQMPKGWMADMILGDSKDFRPLSSFVPFSIREISSDALSFFIHATAHRARYQRLSRKFIQINFSIHDFIYKRHFRGVFSPAERLRQRSI